MKVSVIIPTFNSSNTIERALESIVKQNYHNLEVIIVDDCSLEGDIDRVKKIIYEYQYRLEINFILNTVKSNASATRNQGVQRSSGELISFLDSDDFFLPGKLALQVKHLLSSDADVSFHQLYRCAVSDKYEERMIFPKLDFTEKTIISDYILSNGGLIQTSTLLMKKEIFNKCRFDETLRRHQDFSFVLNLAKLGVKFSFLKKPLTHWVIDETDNCLYKKGQNLDFSLQWIMSYKEMMTNESFIAYLSGTCASFAKRESRLLYYCRYVMKHFGVITLVRILTCLFEKKVKRDNNIL